MNKKFAALSLSFLSVVCLASCGDGSSLSDYEKAIEQANKYNLEEVQANYSGCTVSTYATVTGGEIDEEYNYPNIEMAIEIVTASYLENLVNTHGEDIVEFSVSGTSIKATWNYTTETYNPADIDGDPLTKTITKGEVTSYDDGRFKRTYSYSSVYTALTGTTIVTESESTYSYTAA